MQRCTHLDRGGPCHRPATTHVIMRFHDYWMLYCDTHWVANFIDGEMVAFDDSHDVGEFCGRDDVDWMTGNPSRCVPALDDSSE